MKKLQVKTKYPLLLFVILISTCFFTGCKQKGIPAEEWVLKQYESLDIIELFCRDMDEVISLYIADGISKEDYINELSILDGELALLIADRDEEEIRVGTHTVETKTAMEGYEGVWNDLKELVLLLESDSTLIDDKDKLAYTYLAYQESISDNLDDYMNCYNSLAANN